MLIEFIDETAEKQGTPLNRANMLAVQGFLAVETVFNNDGSITETNAKGEILTTRFNSDGNIVEIFEGEKVITKTTVFNADGSISEVLS